MAPLDALTETWTLTRLWLLAATLAGLAACASMTGCDDKAAADNLKVKIAGQSFYLETALDDGKRFRGLSERTFIEDNGGMIFAFKEPRDPRAYGGFVMRDCPVPIDLMYLDKSGRVIGMHEMLPEQPRGTGEGQPGQSPERYTPEDAKYNARLKQYTSRFPFTFVVELKGGRMKQLGVKEGDLIEFDHAGLIKRAR